jgi:hypothetical protein
MEDQNLSEEQRVFTKEWRDMEDHGRVVVGGARDSPLEGFDTWHSALTRNPPRPSELPTAPAIRGGGGLQVPPEYVVASAGVERCNGNYTLRPELRDQVPCWANENDVMLLRYQLPSGNRYWYLADLHDLTSGRGDFYRVRSDEERPVLAGWNTAGCAAGVEPCPTITLAAPAVAVALNGVQTVRVGQKLEAQDIQYPSLMCVATVKSMADTPAGIEIGVTFDGWGDQYVLPDYLCVLSKKLSGLPPAFSGAGMITQSYCRSTGSVQLDGALAMGTRCKLLEAKSKRPHTAGLSPSIGAATLRAHAQRPSMHLC